MKFKDLKKSLIEKVENFYILTTNKDNEDLFLKNSCINNIKNKVLTDFIDLNLNVFTNENLNADILKKTLDTLPFMSEKRLVLIKENENYKDEKVLNVLKEYSTRTKSPTDGNSEIAETLYLNFPETLARRSSLSMTTQNKSFSCDITLPSSYSGCTEAIL